MAEAPGSREWFFISTGRKCTIPVEKSEGERMNEFKILWNSRVLVTRASHLWRVLSQVGFSGSRQSMTCKLLLGILVKRGAQKQNWAEGEIELWCRPKKNSFITWDTSGAHTAHHTCFTQSQSKDLSRQGIMLNDVALCSRGTYWRSWQVDITCWRCFQQLAKWVLLEGRSEGGVWGAGRSGPAVCLPQTPNLKFCS